MTSRISFDRHASQDNAQRAQRAFLQSQYAQEQKALRDRANMRLAIYAGLAFAIVYLIVDLCL